MLTFLQAAFNGEHLRRNRTPTYHHRKNEKPSQKSMLLTHILSQKRQQKLSLSQLKKSSRLGNFCIAATAPGGWLNDKKIDAKYEYYYKLLNVPDGQPYTSKHYFFNDGTLTEKIQEFLSLDVQLLTSLDESLGQK